MALSDELVRMLRAVPEPAMLVSTDGLVLALNKRAREVLSIPFQTAAEFSLKAPDSRSGSDITETLRTWSRSTEPTPGALTILGADKPTTFNAHGSLVIPKSEQAPAVVLVLFSLRSVANPFVLLNQKIAALNDEIARRMQVEEALRRGEAALRERASEAEALNRAKDEFLATVSHELRTPLNAILGWASLVRMRPLDPQVTRALEVIHRNAEAQSRLIDDILDVSRIITGQMRLELKTCDLSEIVEQAIDVVRPSAAAKHIDLTLVCSGDDELLIADADRLRQAVWNLLSNAVKFTGHGGSVRVQVERRGAKHTVVVSDTGIGVDPTFVPFLFERFKQADGSTTRRTGGLGLGLSLVRHIVELHGGTVEAFSAGAGQGATFRMSFPVRALLRPSEPARSLKPLDRAPPEVPSSLAGSKVLVVDDEPDARELLTTVLSEAGAEVRSAASVMAAFEVLSQFAPHVIVSDIGLPDEDGHSFMRRLRETSGRSVPAIALTAFTRAEDRTKALSAGFATHLGKPVDPSDLVAAVANLTDLFRR